VIITVGRVDDGYTDETGMSVSMYVCTYPAIEGTRVRYKSADDVADEVEALKKAYGVDTFYFTDSIFNDEKGVYLDVRRPWWQRDTGIKWSAFFRPDRIGSDELSLLKTFRALCHRKPGATPQATIPSPVSINSSPSGMFTTLMKPASRLESHCAHYIMFGGPGETDASLKEGLRNIETA